MAVTNFDQIDVQDHDGSSAGLKLGGTLITATAAELNKMDGVAATAAELNQRSLTFEATIGTADTKYLVVPWACSLTTAYSVIDAAIATGNETITLSNDTGAMTGGVITITQSGSAAGDIDSCTPTTNNTFAAGEKLTIAIGGESGGGFATLTFLFSIT